jgi:hypothetical protein
MANILALVAATATSLLVSSSAVRAAEIGEKTPCGTVVSVV